MIKFFTNIKIPKSKIKLTYDNKIMFLGSCFALEMGQKLKEAKFQIEVNPFGTLYNPSSIAKSIYSLINNQKFDSFDLVNFNQMFHSFDHHSIFSDSNECNCLQKINIQLIKSSNFFKQINCLFITFGTAYVYRLKESNEIVANCHKLPNEFFIRERLTVSNIIDVWKQLIDCLIKNNENLRLIFTVSPIRHLKDGAHQNQISKSILLLSIEQLQILYPNHVFYFPAYEIMMDELRDYRFYGDDYSHPSSFAIQYIWERFVEVYTDTRTQSLMKEVNKIQKALNHKPFHSDSQNYMRFVEETIENIEKINTEMPYLCFEEELEKLRFSYNLYFGSNS